MEWVEVTGRTVEEAKDLALDRLGVDERDAEFEVVEEPRAGFFGRLKGEARVRARVKPALRAKPDSGGGRNRRRGRQRAGETETGGRAPVAAATKVKPRSAPRANVTAAAADDAVATDSSEVDGDAGSDGGGERPAGASGRRRG